MFMSIRIAASACQVLQVRCVPRGARMGASGGEPMLGEPARVVGGLTVSVVGAAGPEGLAAERLWSRMREERSRPERDEAENVVMALLPLVCGGACGER